MLDLLRVAREFDATQLQHSAPGAAVIASPLARFLQSEALATSKEMETSNKQKQAVTCCTSHGAKGLEWPCVFIVGAEAKFYPFSRDVAEERRVLYVAMTRAKIFLYITSALQRDDGLSNRKQQLSPFLLCLESTGDHWGSDLPSLSEAQIGAVKKMLKRFFLVFSRFFFFLSSSSTANRMASFPVFVLFLFLFVFLFFCFTQREGS